MLKNRLGKGFAKYRKAAIGICLMAISGMVYADEMAAYLPTPASFYARDILSSNPRHYLLAANERDAGQGSTSVVAVPATPAAEFKPPWMSGRKLHQYFGLGTVALAGLTVLAAPDQESDQSSPSRQPRQTSGTTHSRLARATAAMAAVTVLSGLVVHWNDIHWEDPFTDPDKLHARLAATGALLMIYAVNKSEKSAVPVSHAAIAELGAAAMLVAIKITW